MSDSFDTEVAVVGGGPAGAAIATRLASAGVETVVFERLARPRWRAGGVFSSPLARRHLLELGLPRATVEGATRPIAALQLETPTGSRCRLEYDNAHACGFDRLRLDAALLERARSAGAHVRTGNVVTSVVLPRDDRARTVLRVSTTEAEGARASWHARLVVGADGPGSTVARAAGVVTAARWPRRAGITYHHADPAAAPAGTAMEARFLLGHNWYAGFAPVPGARVNVGIVVPDRALERPVSRVVARVLERVPAPSPAWLSAPALDQPAVALPLAHRVRRAAGAGFLLVGDAAGFLDPLTGEGLHRALVSADLAADAITAMRRREHEAPAVYDRRLRARFRNKDIVSWLLQGFIARPALLDYTLSRLRLRADVRTTLTLVLTDQAPASRALDPRFLARMLVP